MNDDFLYNDVTHRIPKKQLSTLLNIGNAINRSLDLYTVLQLAIDSTVEALDLDTGAIYLLEGDELYLGATTPHLQPELAWLKFQPERIQDHPRLQKALTIRQPVYEPDLRQAQLSAAETAICEARHLVTCVYIPLVSEDKSIGALIVSTTSAVRLLTEDEIALCKVLSSQVALAIINARLYKSLQQANDELFNAYDETLQGWSIALEMRDQETRGHTLRVADLTDKLAAKLKIAKADRVNIRRGALLHDIGKIAVPDMILRKPGPLTSEEWVIMKKHCEFAFEFLLHVDYLLPALDIPYCHHEKWDGSGYPRGLQGEQIPLSARIFTVVDVFDALTSDRPYRKAWKTEDALLYIQDQSGISFDPRIVALFLQTITDQFESDMPAD